MNSVYFQEQEADSLQQNTYSDGIHSVMSNGKNTRKKSSGKGLKTDSSTTPQYTAISEHSLVKGTPKDIEVWLMSLQQDSPASRSVLQESKRVHLMKEICGRQQKKLLKSLNRKPASLKMSLDSFPQKKNGAPAAVGKQSSGQSKHPTKISRGLCFAYLAKGKWMKAQQDLFSTSEEFCETFPKSGTMRNGKLYQRKKQVPVIKETGCGLWRTPDSSTGGKVSMSSLKKMAAGNDKRESGNRIQLSLVDQVKCSDLWPTPTRSAGTGACKHGTGGLDLQTAVKYPTPTNSMMTVGDMNQAKFAGNSKKRPKYEDCNTFPTPTKQDGENNGGKSQFKRNSLPLNAYVKQFPTPSSSDFRDRGGPSMQCIKRRIEKGKQLELSMKFDGNLNPDWVEWLMAWPVGWSNLEPLTELVWLNPSIEPHPELPRVTNISKNRSNRLKAIGNGQYPLCVAEAFNILTNN